MATTITGGTSNDTSTIQGAVNGGGLIIFSPGTYTITGGSVQFFSGGTGKSNITLRGEPGAKIVAGTGYDSVLFDLGSATSGVASSITFENLTFDMTSLSSPNGSCVISGDGNTGITIKSCKFVQPYKGAYLSRQTDFRFVDNEIDRARSGGVWGLFLQSATRAEVRGNRAHDCALDGLKFGPPIETGPGQVTVTLGSPVTVTGTGTSFNSGMVTNKQYLAINGESGRIASVSSATSMTLESWSGSAITTATGYSIGSPGDLVDVIISDNESWSNTQDGINVDSTAMHNVLVSNNIVRDNGSYGMHVKMVYEGTELRRVHVAGNLFQNNTAGGMNVQVNDRSAETLGSVTGSTNTTGTGFLTTMMPGRSITVGGTATTVATVISDTSMHVTGTQLSGTLAYLPENRGMCIFDNQFELFLGTSGGYNYAIRMQRLRNPVIAGNRILGVTESTRGLLIVDTDDALIRGNFIDTNLECVSFENQVSGQATNRNVIEQNVLITRAGTAVYYSASGGSMADHVGNVVRHNEIKTTQFSVLEQSSGASNVRYMNSLGYRTTDPGTSVNGIISDIFWNSAPAAGGVIGWVCTTSGSAYPGLVQWKSFGAIAP